MAQVLLASHTHRLLTVGQLEEVLEAKGLVTATLIETYRLTSAFLCRSEFVVTMGLVSLHARVNPFLPIVHQDKNHPGECRFAARIL